MRDKAIGFAKLLAVGIFGFALGAVEENFRYSIIANEAEKGDKKCQEIMDEFPKAGRYIEDLLS